MVAAPARAVTRPAFKVKLLAQKGCSSIVLDVVGGAALLRHLIEKVVDRCMSEGLVGGESFAADASLIKADPAASWTGADKGAA